MILTLFVIFLVLCIILIFLGYYTDIKALALIAFAGIFLLSMLLQAERVQINTGVIEINHIACGECGGGRIPLYRNTTTEYDNFTTTNTTIVNPDNRTENITIEVTTNYPYNLTTTEFIGYQNINGTGNYTYIASTDIINTYDSIDDNTSKWFGRWLALVSVIAFILVIISNRKRQ